MVALKRLVNAKTKELRALAHQLGAAGRQWRATFDAVQDAIWVLDVEGRILHSNTAAHRLFLTSPEDSRELRCWEAAHGRNGPIDDCPLMVSKRTLRRSIGTVDAGDRKLSVTVDPICDEEGQLAGFVHLVSDVTDKIRSEEELEQYRQGLEDLVRQRTRELEDANADLLRAKMAAESADKLKSAFLATMSHELRTPLNSIIGFTGILLQGLAGSLNEEQDKQMRMVQGSARHLLALINDVLDISKIEAGRMVLAREAFPLAPMVEKVVQSVAPTAQQKGLTLSCHIGDDVGELEGDQRRVEQILMNLLSNAIKFTPQGRVSVTCSRENDTVTLAVRDTGIGIGAEDLATLFRPFQQIETGRTRQFDGTGLGLHICKRLGELMGGSITAESVPQVGSVFTLRLPAKGAEVHAPDEDPHH
ncbi:MAG TPA: ATP-binding protein [Synergistaceae bacterium]|nr:ATP-binding protein [Synergistaceae bacterium]